jgi:uncharacterized protein YqjF (DUF2071 family)
MRWENLLFAHWPVDVSELGPLIPSALAIDTFDGQAWIGIVPFHLTIRYRHMPWSLCFPEVNVRTYVKRAPRRRHESLLSATADFRSEQEGEAQRGVWFLSLDAHSRMAVAVARRLYALPYHLARMRMQSDGTASSPKITFSSQRSSAKAALDVEYCPIGEALEPQPGTLEHWLTERYSLFASSATLDHLSPRQINEHTDREEMGSRHGRVAFGQIDHRPWQLQPAKANFAVNTMLAPLGISTPSVPPLLHYSRNTEALAWKLHW